MGSNSVRQTSKPTEPTGASAEPTENQMPRRMPFAIGRAHGLAGLPAYSHRGNYRRYDSSNANDAYIRGYGEGTRERIRGANVKYDLFELHGIPTPRQRRKWTGL